jgi:hypothetical protein
LSSKKRPAYTLPKPTAYTPFWRRLFCNERTRELDETKQLYRDVTGRFALRWSEQLPHERIYARVTPALEVPQALRDPFLDLLTACLTHEDAHWRIDEPDWGTMGMADLVSFRRLLRLQQHFLHHEEVCLDIFVHYTTCIINGLAEDLGEVPSGRPILRMPLYLLFKDVNATIEELIATFADDTLDEHHIMEGFTRQLYLNVCAVSNEVPDTGHKKPSVMPGKARLEPSVAVDQYLRHTPFHDLFTAPVPFAIPEASFFEHMHVVGGTGAGKTSWLAQLILYHLDDPQAPSIVVVDSQGALIPPLRTLKRIQDRLIYIDPAAPPTINVFDTRGGAGDTFDYLFDGIVGADLTGKQSVFFDFLTRLMLSFPQTVGRTATLSDMIAITADIGPYTEAIAQLPDVPRTFFERDFNSATFKQTREQVRYRLNALLGDEKLERLFGEHTALDLGDALDSGAVILIDTSRQYLGKQSSKFGRLFVFLILQEIFARVPHPQGNPHPVHLIVDEAYEYFDKNIDNLLTQVRKYRCGCVFAHQFLSQATRELRSSLASNTSIKLVSGVSAEDARALAPDLRTTADFILSQPKLHFAGFVKHVTKRAISVEVTRGLLEQEEHVPLATVRTPKQPSATTAPQEAPPPKSTERTAVEGDEIDTGASEEW